MRHHPLGRVFFQAMKKMQQFASMINDHEPAIDAVIGFMDRVSPSTKFTDERLVQNAIIVVTIAASW